MTVREALVKLEAAGIVGPWVPRTWAKMKEAAAKEAQLTLKEG